MIAFLLKILINGEHVVMIMLYALDILKWVTGFANDIPIK